MTCFSPQCHSEKRKDWQPPRSARVTSGVGSFHCQSSTALEMHFRPSPCQTAMTEEKIVGCLCKLNLTRVPKNADEVSGMPLSIHPFFLVVSPVQGRWGIEVLSSHAVKLHGTRLCLMMWKSACVPLNVLFLFLTTSGVGLSSSSSDPELIYQGNNSCKISAHYYFGKPPFCHLNSAALWLPL